MNNLSVKYLSSINGQELTRNFKNINLQPAKFSNGVVINVGDKVVCTAYPYCRWYIGETDNFYYYLAPEYVHHIGHSVSVIKTKHSPIKAEWEDPTLNSASIIVKEVFKTISDTKDIDKTVQILLTV